MPTVKDIATLTFITQLPAPLDVRTNPNFSLFLSTAAAIERSFSTAMAFRGKNRQVLEVDPADDPIAEVATAFDRLSVSPIPNPSASAAVVQVCSPYALNNSGTQQPQSSSTRDATMVPLPPASVLVTTSFNYIGSSLGFFDCV